MRLISERPFAAGLISQHENDRKDNESGPLREHRFILPIHRYSKRRFPLVTVAFARSSTRASRPITAPGAFLRKTRSTRTPGSLLRPAPLRNPPTLHLRGP